MRIFVGPFYCPNEAATKWDWFDKKPNGRGCTFNGDCQSNKCNEVTIYHADTCKVGCCWPSGEMKDWEYGCADAVAAGGTAKGGDVYPKCDYGCCKPSGLDAGAKIGYCADDKVAKGGTVQQWVFNDSRCGCPHKSFGHCFEAC